MRTATTVEAASFDRWSQQRDFAVEAEKLGLDVLWVAEAWGSDAPSALGYYAAVTDRMLLGSGVIQVGTRTPVAVAQAAITLSNLSGGRFLLGLGASGPQVIEGLHGVSFARPLARLKETVEIVRQVVAADVSKLPAYVGMVTFVVAFLITYAATTSLLTAFVIALPLSVGDYLILRGLFPANADLREYNLDARRRVKKVLGSVSSPPSSSFNMRTPSPKLGSL